jgi:hypothetical protein
VTDQVNLSEIKNKHVSVHLQVITKGSVSTADARALAVRFPSCRPEAKPVVVELVKLSDAISDDLRQTLEHKAVLSR